MAMVEYIFLMWCRALAVTPGLAVDLVMNSYIGHFFSHASHLGTGMSIANKGFNEISRILLLM